jgi:hypothetical protein
VSLPTSFSRSHDRAFLDAVATDIIHHHSGRLDYYKGYFLDSVPDAPLLMRISVTLPSFTQQNQSGNETCGVNTKHRWSIASTCRHLSTVGDTMPTVLPRHSPRSRFSKRYVPCYPFVTCLSTGNAASRTHSASGGGDRELPVCEFVAMNAFEPLTCVIIKFSGNGEDFSTSAPAFGSNIWIRSLKNYLKSDPP